MTARVLQTETGIVHLLHPWSGTRHILTACGMPITWAADMFEGSDDTPTCIRCIGFVVYYGD